MWIIILLSLLELAFITVGGVLLTGFTKDDTYLSVVSNGSFLASTLALILYKNHLLGHMSVYLEALAMFLMFGDILYTLNHKHLEQYHENISNEIHKFFSDLFNYIYNHKWIKEAFLMFIVIIAVVFIFPALSSQLGYSSNSNALLKILNKYNIQ